MTRLVLMCKTVKKKALNIHYIANISVSSADCLTHHLPQDASLKQKYFYQKVFSWARVFLQDHGLGFFYKRRHGIILGKQDAMRSCAHATAVGKLGRTLL